MLHAPSYIEERRSTATARSLEKILEWGGVDAKSTMGSSMASLTVRVETRCAAAGEAVRVVEGFLVGISTNPSLVATAAPASIAAAQNSSAHPNRAASTSLFLEVLRTQRCKLGQQYVVAGRCMRGCRTDDLPAAWIRMAAAAAKRCGCSGPRPDLIALLLPSGIPRPEPVRIGYDRDRSRQRIPRQHKRFGCFPQR